MEQTITMMSEEETPEVGPNDIVIHLVNPYKCGTCELEFLEKSVFREHMFSHLEQLKQERPSSQIVMSITLPPETPGGVTVTRDILQLSEDGSIKQVLQPSNITLNQLSPLRELEEAGVLKLEQPKPEAVTPKRIPVSKPKPVANSTVRNLNNTRIVPESESLGLGLIAIDGASDTSGLLKDDLPKEENVGENEVSQVINKDGSLSLAFKGPDDEMQHIQIIRPEGLKGDLMMEFTTGRRRMNRGSGSKSNECDICGKVLSSSTNLLRHKMYHSAERPFVCDVCNKGFKDVSNLKKHTMIHKRIFPCYLCKKSFLRKSLLAMHLRRHESRTTMVKTGNSTKEVVMRTFVDDDGTRVEEMSMAALGGQTFEYKHRIVKADPNEIDREVKKEMEEEKKAVEGLEVVASTESENAQGAAATTGTIDGAEGKGNAQKPMFTVTLGGLQVTSLDPNTSVDGDPNAVATNTDPASTEPIDVDDMPDLKLPPVPDEFVKMYQCGHCGKRTVQRGNMMRHLIHHLKEKPFVCDECPKQFVDKGELVKHKKTHTKPYRCPQCNGAFAHNVQLVKHLQSECLGNLEELNYTVMEDGKTYKCDICRIEMKRLGNMIKHVGTHRGGRGRPWNRVAAMHQKRLNVIRDASDSDGNQKPNAPYYYDSTKRAYFCGFCSKFFAEKPSVQRHVRMHTGDRPQQCTVCHKWLPNTAAMSRHVQIHNKPFKCEQCSAAFSRKLFLEAHMKKHNEPERSEETADYGLLEDKTAYFCKHCDKKLNKYRIMNHVKVHLGGRPFECQTCNKCFSSQYLLLKHKKIHAKPFVCKICGETFTRKFFLVVHRKKVHTLNPSLVKDEANVLTGFEFDRENDRNDGSKDFICSICGAPFARLVIKMNHEKKCRDESRVMMRLPDGKGFKCKICDKVATLKHNLMVHIRKHTDVITVDSRGHISFHDDKNSDNEEEPTITERVDVGSGRRGKPQEKTPEKRSRLASPKKKSSTKADLDSDGSDYDFVGDDDSTEEDADLADDGDGRYKRTPGGFACMECRRKFTDRDTLLRHLDSHGDNQGKIDGKDDKAQESKTSVEGEAQNDASDEQNMSDGKNKDKSDSKTKDESPVPSKKGGKSSAPLGRGKKRPAEDLSPPSKVAVSSRGAKSPRVQASTPSTPSTKSDHEDSATPASARRSSRAQKIPSRFLE